MGAFEAELQKLFQDEFKLAKASLVKALRADLETERGALKAIEKRISELEQEDAEKLDKLEKRAQAREAYGARTSLRDARMSLRGHL